MPWRRGVVTHSSVLAWRIPGTEEPGGLQSRWSQRVRHDWSDLARHACPWYFWKNWYLSWAWKKSVQGSLGSEWNIWGGEGGARGGRGKSYMRGGPSSSWNAVLTDLSTHVDIGMGFPHSSVGKESACNTGDLGSVPGLERSPGEGMATHPSILAWRIPWTEEPGRLQSMGSQESKLSN